MINAYCDYFIHIVTVLHDSKGGETINESDDIKARGASYNKIIVNNKGQEVYGEMTFKFDKKYIVGYDDYIIIKKFKNIVFEMPTKRFLIKKITRPNLIGSESFLKVYI